MSADKFIELIKTKVPFDKGDEYSEEQKLQAYPIVRALSEDDDFSEELFSSIDFSTENIGKGDEFGAEDVRDSISYLHDTLPLLMTEKGIPYLFVSAGGDWEIPLVFMIYWDGNRFRAYVPLKGNVFNRDTMAAFGNYDEDERFLVSEGLQPEDIATVNADYETCIADFEGILIVKV